MGKIYRWMDVLENRIPNLDGYEIVADKIRSEISKSSSILAAILCGSYVRGDHTIRSSIDCVVIYKNSKRKEATKILTNLNVFAAEHHVPLEFIPIDDTVAGTPHHFITSTFIEHLSMSSKNGGNIKGDALDIIQPNEVSIQDDTVIYLINKMRKLQRGSVMTKTSSSSCKYISMQRALELGVYSARKILRCRDSTFSGTSTKKKVLREYGKISTLAEANELLVQITDLDTQYSEVLERTVQVKSRRSYLAKVDEIKKITPTVLKFAQLNLDYLSTMRDQ